MIYGNLVENTVKYSRDGGRVVVRLRRDGIYAAVSITDQGIGIAPADCEKIFDEFYRARGENTAAIPGTGLGLSLVKRLTELHQGTVSVTSALGQGSEFTVRIPCSGPAALSRPVNTSAILIQILPKSLRTPTLCPQRR